MNRLATSLGLLSVLWSSLQAQARVPIDTVARTARPDTTAASAGAAIDTIVTYSAADSIVFSLRAKRMDLFGRGQTNYQTIGLKAERVSINWVDATLNATGMRDTVRRDSTIGKPILRDGGEEYHGDRVRYNFRTRKGKITIGQTEMDDAFYRGEQIKKVETDVLYVEDGRYTTCDAVHPHYYFSSPKMKVFVRDKVVAEPVYFYIADVPVFALPFGVFPSHSGRASGLIAPAYGSDNQRGQYFSHLGYYWALNDYMDLATAFSYYTRGGWENRSDFRYRLRYEFSGVLDARVASKYSGETTDPTYNKEQNYYLSWIHGEELTPTSRLDVNFTFMSSNYLRNYSTNLNEYLSQDIFSNATYWKSWESSNRTLTVNVQRQQNLNSGNVSELLPSVSFSQGRIFPFRQKSSARSLGSDGSPSAGFWEMLGLDYNANFSNQRLKSAVTVDSVKELGTASLQNVKDFSRSGTQSLQQSIVFSISPKVGRVNITPSLSFSDARVWNQYANPQRGPDSLLFVHDSSAQQVAGRVSAGVSASTRLYGVMQPHIFGITAFRHTLVPTFGLTYSKQVYGERIPKYSFVGSMSLNNTFEMKYQKADTAKEEKLQLLVAGANVFYNFAADSMRLSDLSVNFRTDIGRILNISGGATYSFYEFDPASNGGYGGRVNRYLLSNRGKLADLTSFSLSISTSYQAQKKSAPANAGVPERVLAEQEGAMNTTGLATPKKTYYSIYDREDADFSIPWNVSLGYTFALSQADPRTVFRTSSVNFSLSFNLTDKWQIATTGSYDFVNKQHFIPSVDVTRDLHCWEMRFTWRPMGYLAGYRLEIRVKAPQLQDLKLTKQSSNLGVYY